MFGFRGCTYRVRVSYFRESCGEGELREFHVAIAGATGAVGTEFLRILEQREFPLASLRLLASERSAGRRLHFRGRDHEVKPLTPDSFQGCDIACFSAGGSCSRELAPAAVAAGAL